MTITLRFLKALTATTTAMQAEVLVITALLDGNIQIHCQKELLNLIERFYSAPKPDKFSKLDASYSADLDQIFKNFNANLLALYVKFMQHPRASKKRRLTLQAAQAKYRGKVKKLLEKSLFLTMIVTEGYLKATVQIKE